ncbi:MAG: accessory factor UbiK family protein [Sinobacterium sp.]|jgi:BMFP domain-containing protein YqiC|tara:strand:- start:159 stop:401 length:243 start_codon:yes stop_codon:yes gene_type:complete
MVQPFITEFVRQLGEILPTSAAKDDIQKGIHAVAQSAFAKMDLVTREEFDAQQAVLMRTRAQLEAMETQLAELNKQLENT